MTIHLAHWGAFEAESDGHRITRVRPWSGDPEPSPLIGNVVSAQHDRTRVDRPYVRRGWLERGPGGGGRGEEDFVAVSWDRALDLFVGAGGGVCGCGAGGVGDSSARRVGVAGALVRRADRAVLAMMET